MTLAKTYNPKDFEGGIYSRTISKFSSLNHCAQHNKNKLNGKTYSILMPPPNVTGTLHLGHALTYTIQDILIRYHRQKGYDVLWQPGVDHAGIAMQMVVDRKLREDGIDPASLTKEEFIAKIFEWREEFGGRIVEQQKLLGCSATWDESHFTMDPHCSEAVIEAFVQLYEDGLIYKDKALVNWDTKLETAISDLEIINKEEKGKLWYLMYMLAGDPSKHILIATSRPETIFADVAVAVNPEDERYRGLIGQEVLVPLIDKHIKIIADEHADKDKGSGCVKITPAHDHNDFAVGKRHGLEMICVIDKRGHMIDEDPVPAELRGVFLAKARKMTVAMLESAGLLDHEEEVVHSVPYGDRTNMVIEPMLTDQWFVDAPALAAKAIEAVESGATKFHPEKWENTYFDWMRNIRPWCISRQIIWGHRIPAYYTPDDKIIVSRTIEEAEAKAIEMGYSPDQLRQETDVLDTWFSSGLWAFETMGWPLVDSDTNTTEKLTKYYPTSTLVTGFDIIFFWVARMMMLSLYFCRDVPFRDIYVHALIRDEKGQKMSKSKGNVIDPLSLMEEFGADALRYTMAFMSVPGRDIKLGKDNVKISRNFITKIWNAARFLQMNEVPFDKSINEVTIDNRLSNWIVAKLKKLQAEVDENMREYRFDFLARTIQYFLRDHYCDFFIEALKFVNDDNTKVVAGAVFLEFLRIINPVMPFVSTHLVQQLRGCEAVSNVSRSDDVSISDVGNCPVGGGASHMDDLLFSDDEALLSVTVDDESDIDKFLAMLHEYRGIPREDESSRSEMKNRIVEECDVDERLIEMIVRYA